MTNKSGPYILMDPNPEKGQVLVVCLSIPQVIKHLFLVDWSLNVLTTQQKYEALLQGLRKALDMDVQNLVVFGDSEIVVKQVRNAIHCLSPHLKNYQTEVWGLMHKFLAFNINSIPRMSNSEVDLLANVASKLLPVEGLSPNAFSVELLFRPSIPDNITNWRVFDDDQQIINFLHMEDTFQDAVIDESTHDENL
jgi:hypothetical protein